MKNSNKKAHTTTLHMLSNKGFTFIELIIVVTIIAILSVTAFTVLTGETEKARDAKRLSDLSATRQALEQYYLVNSFYPQPTARDEERTEHAWGYRPKKEAVASCVTKFDNDLNQAVYEESFCGGDIRGVDNKVIGWKGVLSNQSGKNSVAVAVAPEANPEIIKPFSAEFIQNLGSDPKLSGDTDFKDKGIGEYIYAVYRGELAETDLKNGGVQYQLATTLEKGGPDERETYIIGTYTQKRGKLKDPFTLIGSGENVILHEQRIGQNNEEVTNKKPEQKKIELEGKLSTFEDEIQNIQDKTQISEDAQNFLNQALELLEEIEGDIDNENFDQADNTLNEVREIMKESLNRFYQDASLEIFNNMKTAVREDTSESAKENALNKAEELKDIAIEINRSAKNSRRFESKSEELKVRREIDKQLDVLLNEDIQDLKDILDQGGENTTEIIPSDLEDSISTNSGDFDFANDSNGTNEFTLDDEEEAPSSSNSSQESVEKEIEDLEDMINEIRDNLLDVDTEKVEFVTEYSEILLDLSDLEKAAEDVEEEITNIDQNSDRFGTRELEQLTEDLSQENDPRKRLELVLDAENSLTGGALKRIQVTFDEALLGESAGQPGSIQGSPTDSTSPYTGIPYPLEISE